ncbi:MAG: dockerin type I domain-containing protein [Acutalibacteraceae bacterium]|nr:dockerin type I domain-containing protein [Acutalibacteraceae bacterium]
MKKILCVILSFAMLLCLSLSANAYTINKDDAEIGAGDIFGDAAVYFDDASVKNGESVTVDLMIIDNVGFTELNIALTLDNGITVETVANGELGEASLVDGKVVVTSDEEIEADGCIAKITFKAEAEGNKNIIINVVAKNGDKAVNISGSDCVIVVEAKEEETVRGDIDGDGALGTTDLALLKLALANGTQNELNNADVDGDGVINTSDLAKMKLVLAGI